MHSFRIPKLAPRQSVLLRLGGLAIASWLLLTAAGCGGGDDDNGQVEAFTVSVELAGFDQTEARSGEEAAGLTVEFWKLDLSNVQLNSSTATTWSVEPESAVVNVIEDTPTRRVVSLAGMKTGEVTFVFRDSARNGAGEARVRIAVEGEAQRYYANRRRIGETFEVRETVVGADGKETKYTDVWRVTEVGGGGSYTMESDPPQSGFSEWYSLGGNWTAWEFASLSGVYSNPSNKSYDFPLYVGKEWPTEHLRNVYDEEIETLRRYGMSTVQGREVVTVPAGAYDSLRIYTREAVYGPGDNGSAYERTCWWSIELSAEVRCEGKTSESRWTSELVKYTAP
jgi:hypothetical protein